MGRGLVGFLGLSGKRSTLLPVLIAVAAMLILGVLLDGQNQQIAESRQRADTLAKLSVIRAKLEGNIISNIQLVKGLVATLSTEPDMDQERYGALARNIFEAGSQLQLRSVAAAPDLVIRMTYPREGNEAVIGIDYRTLPAQWEAVDKVRQTGQLFMAGPIDLMQGGEGLIGRFPVYTERDGARHFWGIVAAVLDVNQLYVDSGITGDLDFDLSITGLDGAGARGKRFYGPDLHTSAPVLADVMLPSGSWRIAAVPRTGWGADPVTLWAFRGLILLAGALILLPIVITMRMVAERHDHIQAMSRREAELAELSGRLNLALEVSKVGVWELDMANGVENWDRRTCELFGLAGEDGAKDYHEHWLAALHPEDRERAASEFDNAIAQGRYESDFRIVLPDGAVRHIRSTAVLLAEPGGGPEKVLGVNWDITSDVELNENLRRAKREAEARNRDLEIARTRIEHNALHDSLTGLPNRRYLDEILQRHAADGYRGSGSIALLHIDLDRFKQINDTLGHATGDAMLIHASRVLRNNCRDTDFVARIGGDEFLIVSSAGSSDEQLNSMASRIVSEMRRPVMHEGHECRFGVSIGVAASRAANIDVKQLLINADIALYRAKARGRNRHEFFSEALQAEVVHTKRLADEILSGLEANAFLAYYQPQFDAHTLNLVGVEALARWQHPVEGLRTPDCFLGIAEELNVVTQIDRLVLDQALADLERWDRMGLNVPRASVNVSLRRLHDDGLIASLRALQPAPGRLAFELVESIYLDEGDGVVAWNIDRIKELGIEVEIDDFGTGYASIVSLQKLHPHRLKIDRQLVLPILDQPAQRQLVASIVDIGKSMDIEIVAEGVETMQHAAILRDLGCDILQGYAFARPMSRDDLEAFVSQEAWRRTG